MNREKEIHLDFSLPNACEIDGIIENYLVNSKDFFKDNDNIHRLYAFQEPKIIIPDPTINIWAFMSQKELEEIMEMKNNTEIRSRMDHKIGEEKPRGVPRDMFVSLMYNVIKFCKKTGYNTIESAVILSTFYLTHLYFTSKIVMSAEKLYNYFRDLLLYHCLPFPPNSKKILAHNQTAIIMETFCKLYLRNLPLIRMLTLPNFAFYLHYDTEEDIQNTEQNEAQEKDKQKYKKGNIIEKGSKKGSKKDGKKKGK